jgi:plasmid segregation protein ParM
MMLGLDIGFGFTKSVARFGADIFPSVVGDWTTHDYHIGCGFDRKDQEAIEYEGREYLVGERALKLTHRLFVGLSREWFDSVPFKLLALTAIRRRVAESGMTVTLVTGLPVDDLAVHAATVKQQLEGTHTLTVLPAGTPWEVTIAEVHVLPQPLGTVFSQVLDDSGVLTRPRIADASVGVLDVGFRTSDYFSLRGLEIVPDKCLTRNTGVTELMLDVSRELSRRHGVETDPHALNDVVLRRALPVGNRTVDITVLVDALLDRHADAIAAHARMLWGDGARGLQFLWLTGGGAMLLGARLQQLAPHAELVENARIQNAVGYYRFGLARRARR